MSLSRGNKRAEGHIARTSKCTQKRDVPKLSSRYRIDNAWTRWVSSWSCSFSPTESPFLSLYSLSLCLNVAFGFLFWVGCFFSKTVLPLFVLLLTKKIQTTKKNNERKKKKERRTKRRKRDKQKFKEQPSIHSERERETTVLNTMECYFFVLRKYKQTHKS